MKLLAAVFSMMFLTIAFGQVSHFEHSDIRLSPRLLNYQGYLTDTLGIPITNPSVSMTFSIFDALSSGNQKWTETQSTVGVDKGIFHVLLGGGTPIPDSVFKAGADRWLELSVAGQTLAPRTRIVSVPFAYTATYSDTALYAINAVADNDWNFLISDGADTTLQMGGRWGIGRFGNTMYGNADSTHVNFGVECTTGTNGQNYGYCTVGGGHYNSAGGGFSATVSGGDYNKANGNRATVGGGQSNTASGWCATVSGGIFNTASNWYATVGGGDENGAGNQYSTVGGGRQNTANGWIATVAGGWGNTASGERAMVGGGEANTASNEYTTVGGGQTNTANSVHATVAGGRENTASGYAAIVGGGWHNTAGGYCSAVGGGTQNNAVSDYSFIGSGYNNYSAGYYSSILDGYADSIFAGANYSYLFGINSNLTQDSTFMVDLPHIRFGTEATGYEFPVTDGTTGQALVTDGSGQVSWGSINDNDWSFLISDGADTTLQTGGRWGIARFGNTMYGNADSTHVNLGIGCVTGTSGSDYKFCTVGGGSNNTSSGEYATIGGGRQNTAYYRYATVGGGTNNSAGPYSIIGGGEQNIANYWFATVAGGSNNVAGYDYATVGGGSNNTTSCYATVGGGNSNAASSYYSTVAGGRNNSARDTFSIIGGGSANQVVGLYSAILGGYADTITATGDYSYLFGIKSKLTQDSTFMVDMPHIWFGKESDGYEFPVTDGTTGQALVTDGSGQVSWGSTDDNDWTISGSNMYSAVSGNVGIGTTTPSAKLSVWNGNISVSNGGVLSNTGYWGDALRTNWGNDLTLVSSYADKGILFRTQSGEKMRIDADGNVGIGTTGPAEKLDVAGTAQVTGFKMPTGATNGCVLTSDVSGIGTWQNIPTDNDWSFLVSDGADTTLQMGGQWGLTRPGNVLYGNADSTHVNLGLGSVTGRTGEDNKYCTVSGGMYNTANRDRATVGGGWYNTAGNYEATVGGGSNNNAGGNQSTISGGAYNVATDDGGTIGGGYGNTAASGTGFYATVGGGQFNAAGGYMATIGGGENNTASGNFYATVGGGYGNTASGDRATVSGGVENLVAGAYSAILGGYADTITSGGSYSYLFGIKSKLTQDSTFMIDMPHIRFGKESGGYEFPVIDGSSGQALVTDGSGQVSWGSTVDTDWSFLVSDGADTTLQTGGQWGLARFGNTMYGNADSTHVNLGVGSTTGSSGQNYKYITVGGGYGNIANYNWTTVGGGDRNTAGLSYATVSGGVQNSAGGQCATVGGGSTNVATSECATVAGGNVNAASNYNATVSGGQGNIASGYIATVGGGKVNRARGAYSVISGGGGGNEADSNSAIGDYSAIGGGYRNIAVGNSATIGGGNGNRTSVNAATIGGGQNNTAWGDRVTIGGGNANNASNQFVTIGGGTGNNASGNTSTIVGGNTNTASGEYATVGAGVGNTASGNFTVVGGGWSNNASGNGAIVTGGYYNSNAGDWAAILGGNADTIFATGDYSYLFGINSNLTQDSTFMVDLPHIRFGTEAAGYEFPVTDGTTGQALVTNGSGQVSWGTPAESSRIISTYTPSGSSDPYGNVGDMALDDSYVYFKTSTGWKRSTLANW